MAKYTWFGLQRTPGYDSHRPLLPPSKGATDDGDELFLGQRAHLFSGREVIFIICISPVEATAR
jgi:hypothetical protein